MLESSGFKRDKDKRFLEQNRQSSSFVNAEEVFARSNQSPDEVRLFSRSESENHESSLSEAKGGWERIQSSETGIISLKSTQKAVRELTMKKDR